MKRIVANKKFIVGGRCYFPGQDLWMHDFAAEAYVARGTASWYKPPAPVVVAEAATKTAADKAPKKAAKKPSKKAPKKESSKNVSSGAGGTHECPDCDKTFKTASRLRSHVSKKHG